MYVFSTLTEHQQQAQICKLSHAAVRLAYSIVFTRSYATPPHYIKIKTQQLRVDPFSFISFPSQRNEKEVRASHSVTQNKKLHRKQIFGNFLLINSNIFWPLLRSSLKSSCVFYTQLFTYLLKYFCYFLVLYGQINMQKI